MTETEVKILDIDKDRVVEQLIELGAQEVSRGRMLVRWFKPTGFPKTEAPWYLRVRRRATGKTEVTWKSGTAQTDGVARRVGEIEIYPDDFEKSCALLQAVGFEQYAVQEKDRQSFELGGVSFDIDDYPEMPPFVEIEAASGQEVEQWISILGLQDYATWNDGERTLINDHYGLDWFEMKF